MDNSIGKIRQSMFIMSHGPGAIVDFRVPGTGAAVSIVTAGLEEWENNLDDETKNNNLIEPRLAAKLDVQYFKLPPVSNENNSFGKNKDEDEDDTEESQFITGVRFPQWLQCPQCNSIKPVSRWGGEFKNPSRYCDKCSVDTKVYVIPVRFILSCRNGHLDEFPWYDWVHSDQNTCTNNKEFKLESQGPGLAGLMLSCPKCTKSRSMEYAIKQSSHANRKCTGKGPWLTDADEPDCDQKPITLQRGASNLYFPQMESALIIPPWSDTVIQMLGNRWNDIKTCSVEDRVKYITLMWSKLNPEIQRMGIENFIDLINLKIEDQNHFSENLRLDEFNRFIASDTKINRIKSEFQLRDESLPVDIPHISSLKRVVSLKEIRALKSFTRIESPPGKPRVRQQFLSRAKKRWLPAIEVTGEGIFISLNETLLKEWEENNAVLERVSKVKNFDESNVLNVDNKSITITANASAKYLLLHSLAHVLMKQLSLQCGYSTASLRERIYADNEGTMAGVLIFTATTDSDGTLGGLQREGKISRFEKTFIEAIHASEWCSSDPLCINGILSATESSSIASCHSCLLAPETSCEDYNRFLDRAMLIGTPEDRSIGFFHQLLSLKR